MCIIGREWPKTAAMWGETARNDNAAGGTVSLCPPRRDFSLKTLPCAGLAL